MSNRVGCGTKSLQIDVLISQTCAVLVLKFSLANKSAVWVRQSFEVGQ
jgi:hypothetical protein